MMFIFFEKNKVKTTQEAFGSSIFKGRRIITKPSYEVISFKFEFEFSMNLTVEKKMRLPRDNFFIFRTDKMDTRTG